MIKDLVPLLENRACIEHLIAVCLMDLGDYRRPPALLEEATKIKEEIHDKKHPSYLESQHELARAYMGNCDYHKAVKLLKELVKIKETMLDETHPSRLASQHLLAKRLREH